MAQIPFTKEEQAHIEESIMKTTNINVRSVLKRTKHIGIIKQMCYLVGCEIINLKNILDQIDEPNLTFGFPLYLDHDMTQADQTMNKSALVNHLSIYETTRYHDNQPMLRYLNQLLTVRRKIEKSVTKVLQKKIDSFLYSSSQFLRYSRDNMTMERIPILTKLKKVELLTLEEAKASSLAATQEEDHLSDLSNVYKDRGMVKYNAVATHIDLDTLQQDFKQYNKDMMHMIMRKCGKRSVSLFQTIHQAGMQENPDDKYISVNQFDKGQKMLAYLKQVNVLEDHINNDKLVKMTNM